LPEGDHAMELGPQLIQDQSKIRQWQEYQQDKGKEQEHYLAQQEAMDVDIM
jgi:hypothetical protein